MHIKKRSRFNININIDIYYIVIFSILISLCILYCSIYVKKQFKNYILESIENISTVSSTNINNQIKNTFNILTNIASNLTFEELQNPEETVKKFYSTVENNQFKKMAIATLDGTSYVHTGEVINVADRDYFQKSLNKQNFVSSIVSSKIDSKKANVYSVPILKNNEVVGVLWASSLTEVFYKNININTTLHLGDTFIMNQNGNLIVSSLDLDNKFYHNNKLNFFNQPYLNTKENANELQKLKNNLYNFHNGYNTFKVNGSNIYIYYAKLSYNDWWTVTTIPEKVIKNSYKCITNTITLITTIAITLLIILFSIIINKKRKISKNLKDLTYKDNITNGKNDLFLKENLNKIIDIQKGNFAFISLEIVNIKTLVNTFGLKNTELILKDIYTYLNSILGNYEIVVHSYFGEYKLVLKYNDITKLTERLKTINFSKIHDNIDYILGIYLITENGDSFEDICSYVSIAKKALDNTNNYMIYNKELHKKEIDELKLKADIKNGINNKEFKAWFQPKYGKDGKTIIGAEALCRWYKYGSIISPYIFINICEEIGLIKNLDEIIFEDVCKNLREWLDKNKKVVPISINLSRNYLDKSDLILVLDRYINKYKIPRNLIQFEITESTLIKNEEKFKNIISILHNKGFKILLDDFGMGYSSIKSLSDNKLDILKIDKSFIDGIGNENMESIIIYTINLANSLGMEVIAEGIETKEQYEFLLKHNCNMFQGYYFNKPLSSDDFSKLI